MSRSRAKEAADKEFTTLSTSNGWEMTKRGWPDYLIKNAEGKMVAVVIVPDPETKLRNERAFILDALAGLGMECYLWSPEGGFVRYEPESDGGSGGAGQEEVESSPEDQQETLPVGEGVPRGDPGRFASARGEVSSIECPNCGAAPGAPCVGARGKERTSNHAERVRAFETGKPVESVTKEVNRVWQHYVEVMKPRSTIAGDQERSIIRAALKVSTADECLRAIDGCAASAFHMGQNDRKKKYNKLSSILRGRKGMETTRERIDFFLDYAEKSASGSEQFPSASTAVIARKKTTVQRGARFRDDPERVREAQEAEAWLQEHGIETVRREDGYPVFRALRRA